MIYDFSLGNQHAPKSFNTVLKKSETFKKDTQSAIPDYLSLYVYIFKKSHPQYKKNTKSCSKWKIYQFQRI